MIAPVTTKQRCLYAADFAKPTTTWSGHSVEMQADGTAIVRGIEIFKSGSFKDSWGELHTWETDHLRQMADNFTLLKGNGVFPNVPVRADHSMSVERVVGYVEGLYTTDNDTRLVADIHVTEPPALDKLVRGSYRSVSNEVGMYETNDGAAYWPVVFGFAYVDIPAVEGLHSRPKDQTLAYFSRQAPQEDRNVATETNNTDTDKGTPKPFTFRVKGVDTTDHAAVQRHIAELEVQGDALATENAALKAVVEQNVEDGRKAYVTALLAEGKIVKASEEGLIELFKSYTPEQFEAAKKLYDAQPKLAIMAEHGAAGGGGNQNGADSEPSKEDKEIEVARQAVAMFRRQKQMTEEQIANTKAGKILAAAGNKN